ncbi:ATP-dependent DNA/RNA helicase DHX36-like [Aphis gossypii]|uniref:ATP-dependent DNA/RNA helicase DHX36-like n=1 Tax=Aphis gossypii TaxID=80765 RepID=UPI0021599D93|nr:ATP-dependent DNA/RNA helicase DHX36-like [Aphis gossypii]
MPPMKPFRINKQTGPKDKNKGPRQGSKSNQHDHDDFILDNGGPSNTNDKQKSRSSHPPHLKGRDIGLWHARKQASMREDEEMLDMARPKVKPPSHLRGRELDMWHKEQNRIWQKSKKKEQQKELGKCFIKLRIEEISRMEMQFQQLEEEMPIPDENIKPSVTSNSKLNTKDYSNHNYRALNLLTLKDEDVDENAEYIIDRYKKLEDSNFKRKFLDNITGSMEENLVASIQSNMKLQNDESKNAYLRNELENKRKSVKYRSMCEIRKKLPSYTKKDEILELIHKNQVILISGETGCGKTTQMAQFILDDAIMSGRGSTCRIVCTQPRRISAISVAERVADERAERIGEASVGYQIRLERKLGREYGSILFCTTGILLQHIQRDSALNYYSHIIIDEIHERDTISDFTLTILKSIIPVRPDIKVILMSATLNAAAFSKYYNDCPSLNIPGFTYPVEELYLEDIYTLNKFRYFPKKQTQRPRKIKPGDPFSEFVIPYVNEMRRFKKCPSVVLNWLENPSSEDTDYELISELINYICNNKDDGAILVFLSGWDQISKLTKLLKDKGFGNTSRYILIPLHSMLPTVSQKSVFESPPRGVRKIILSTNIAETSVTIDDVVYVINNGRMKLKGFDAENNIGTLNEEWVSLANSRQRRGRAGRVRPGICYHLYTRGRERSFNDYVLPEMMRTSLEEVILQAKILQVGMVTPFLEKVMNPPETKTLEVALKLLIDLNALDEKENLTPLGFHLAKLPIGPLEGKMIILGAMFSCLSPIMTIAASLNFKDPFVMPANKEYQCREIKKEMDEGHQSDHLMVTRAMSKFLLAKQENRAWEFCRENFLMFNTMNMLHELKSQYAKYLCDLGFIKTPIYTDSEYNQNSNNVKLLKCVLAAGLCPNIAVSNPKIKSNGRKFSKFVTAEDGKVEIHPKSVNSIDSYYESPLLLYHTKLKTTSIFLHDTTMIYPFPVVLFAKSLKINGEKTDHVTFSLNPQINFTCSNRTAVFIKQVRKRLKFLIDHLMSHPEEISFNSNSGSGKALKLVVDLVSAEEHPGVLEFPFTF